MTHWLFRHGMQVCLALTLAMVASGCKQLFESGVEDNFVNDLTGTAVGGSCTDASDCRSNLICEENVCAFAANTAADGPCLYTQECAPDLYCDHTRRCAAAGTTPPGGACTTNANCERGSICVISGFEATCVASGTADQGESCTTTTSCLAGLTCTGSGDASICAAPLGQPAGTPAVPPIPLWTGAACGADVTEPTAYFEVPRNGQPLADFYRLPFPNDIRRTTTGIDMSDHPRPPTVLNVPIIDRYLTALSDMNGFSTNPVMIFRFSAQFDWDDVRGALFLIDVTEDSPTYGEAIPLHWFTTRGQVGKYVCRNWLAFAPGAGNPLRPGTTYAAIVTRSVRSNDDRDFNRASDLDALLGATAPGNADLAAAHAKYAPLRAWLADSANTTVTAANILNATVFTTQDPRALMPALRQVITGDTMPTVTDLTVCGANVTSPCADGTPQRDCSAPNPRFTEIHGRIRLPVFQHGTAPYEDPEDGGGVVLDSTGRPTIARHENVCFALTIPNADVPDEGFPLMLYAHGTGGSFTNAVRNGLAADVADDSTAAATLAIDLPQHGTRRGASDRDPDVLFYNFLNPAAARDNVLQGAADLFSLVRWAQAYEQVSTAVGGEVRFNSERIALFAHSQGATHASLMFSYEPGLDTVLLSGNGGHLITSLLTKENPVNIKAVLPFAMLDANPEGRLTGGEFHAMLAVFQTYFDRVDPLNFAPLVHTEPTSLAPAGQHVFMTYGLGDTYSTEKTMQQYARAASLPHVTPVLDNISLPEIAPPLSANITLDSTPRTIGVRQYRPSTGEDGHFVSTDQGAGRTDVLRFLRAALSGAAPVIGE